MRQIKPIKLEKNRVWRTYKGGKKLCEWLGEEKNGSDSHFPEEWIASTVPSFNGKNVEKEKEGYSQFLNNENEIVTLLDFIKSNPEEILGRKHINKFGTDTGVLIKILDAAERLAIQVHPSADRAKELFSSSQGKTEAWLILDGREVDGDQPHIFAGFKPGISKGEIENYFEQQNVELMLDSMNKIYVNPGEVYLIRGGLPHAIGAGCLILEIQEATDLTIRLERKSPSGFEIEESLIHQGLGYEKMFDCFEWKNYDETKLLDHIRLINHSFDEEGEKTLISYNDTPHFAMKTINIFSKRIVLEKEETFTTLVITKGKGYLKWDGEKIELTKGDKVFCPLICDNIELIAEGEMSLIRCYPPIV